MSTGGSNTITRYPLEEGEVEVPTRGRVGPHRSDATAHLMNDGTVRVNCMNNLEFHLELSLPPEYIRNLYHRME